jgi:hypothetical protein
MFCITGYYVVLLMTIHMQLMAAMRYFDRLESQMSQDQFQDLVRKVKLALAPRIRASASGAALLDEVFQVGQCFIVLHIITLPPRVIGGALAV